MAQPFDNFSFTIAAISPGFSITDFNNWKMEKDNIERTKQQQLDKTQRSSGNAHFDNGGYSQAYSYTYHNNTHTNTHDDTGYSQAYSYEYHVDTHTNTHDDTGYSQAYSYEYHVDTPHTNTHNDTGYTQAYSYTYHYDTHTNTHANNGYTQTYYYQVQHTDYTTHVNGNAGGGGSHVDYKLTDKLHQNIPGGHSNTLYPGYHMDYLAAHNNVSYHTNSPTGYSQSSHIDDWGGYSYTQIFHKNYAYYGTGHNDTHPNTHTNTGSYYYDHADGHYDTHPNTHTDNTGSNYYNHVDGHNDTHPNTHTDNTGSNYYNHVDGHNDTHPNTHTNMGSYYYDHANGHSDTHQDNIVHSDYGFDHENFIPSKPYVFAEGNDASTSTPLRGTVTLGFYSYDKSKEPIGGGSPQIAGVSQVVQYYVRIRKVRNLDNTPNVSSWRVLLNWATQETFDLDTLYPLGAGIGTPKSNEGYYEIEVTARNPQYSANGMTRTYIGQTYTVEVKIQQDVPPSIEVKNGDEFINFIFSEEGAYSIAGNYYRTYEEGLYSEASDTQKEGLFVVVSMTDTDADDWQKGSIKLQLPDGSDIPGATAPIIWTDTGTQITKSSGTAKKGYAFVPKTLFVDPYDTYIDDARVVVTVTDYSDQNCTAPINTVMQVKESALSTARMLVFDIDKNMTHDTLSGELSIHKTPTYVYTKWHKDKDGKPAKMDISITWNNLQILTLQGDGTVLSRDPVTITRVESEHILNRYTEMLSTANGELISESLSAVGPGTGTYQAAYQYDKAGDENSPFIFRLYYMVNGEEHHATIRVNIPVNGITTTLRKAASSNSEFKKASTDTFDANTWYYTGAWLQDSELSVPVFNSLLDALWPLPGQITISSYFGQRIDPIDNTLRFHYGIDIPAPEGTTIVSPVDGTVVYTGWDDDYGNMLVIRSGGYDFLFGHCSSILVTTGQPVSKGQAVAKVGSTGRSTGPHLDLRVTVGPYTQGNYIDPLTVVKP